MDESLEITNVKNEPTKSTSSDHEQILPDMYIKRVQQDNNCLIQSEIYIKTEPEEDENEFSVIAGTSYGMYPNYDMKIEMEEPMIKIECEDRIDEILKDPLDVGSDIKDQLLVRNDSDCKDKKYICSECNKKFRLKGDLNRHLRIHTGQKPFSCEICKKSFTQKSHLNGHMLIHSGEKPHICDVCKKIFRLKSLLDYHKLIHSGVKQFSCDVCDKSFAQKQHLVVHKRIHTGDKPFICDLCNKAFIQKTSLIQHKRVHTGEKPFSCDTCNKSFVQKEHLNRHKKIHKK